VIGCLRSIAYQIGCAVVGLLLVVLAFIYREQVVAVYHKLRGNPPRSEAVYAMPTDEALREARRLLDRLEERNGPAFVDLSAAHVAALIEDAVRGAGRSLDSVAVGLLEGEIRVRGSLDMTRLPRDLLPRPLRGMVGSREPVIIGGPMGADSAGRLYLEIVKLDIANLPLPRALIARVMREARVPGLEGTRVPLPAMRGVGDVRVMPDYVRAYRRAPR